MLYVIFVSLCCAVGIFFATIAACDILMSYGKRRNDNKASDSVRSGRPLTDNLLINRRRICTMDDIDDKIDRL